MLKSLMREVTLAVQARTGATPALLVWGGVIVLAAVMAFIFLCVAVYDWIAIHLGGVWAALIMTGFFVLVAFVAAAIGAVTRRRARERAILERAARKHSQSWLLDPKILGTALQLGRTLGWQRLVPVALLGVMAAQWAREYRHHEPADHD